MNTQTQTETQTENNSVVATATDLPTLREFLAAKKMRKGKAHGVSERGAWWVALQEDVGSYGGDGIGKNLAKHTVILRVRHYRDSATDAADPTGSIHTVILRVRHYLDGTMIAELRDGGWTRTWEFTVESYDCNDVLDCTTIEQVEAVLKRVDTGSGPLLTPRVWDGLEIEGFAESPPAPDEA